jgi:hypothetical protein
MQIELKDRVKRMTVFQTYVFDYYFWVNLDERCPHTVTVYPNFCIFTGVNCRNKFNMRICILNLVYIYIACQIGCGFVTRIFPALRNLY